jgi:GAF domain-containing protein/ketosteroid isomerase-like protein
VSQPRSIVGRSHEVFNARDLAAYPEVLDERVELVISGVAVHGLAAVIEYLTVATGTRPGLRVEADRVFVETQDTLVTEVRMVDTTDSRDEAATLEYSAVALYRVAGGRIVQWRVYLDPPAEGQASAAFAAVAAEQSALRRVAELVARHGSSERVFAVVTEELSRLLGVKLVRTVRFEPDGSTTVLASLGKDVDLIPPGANVTWPRGSVTDQVLRTGRPARVDDYAPLGGPIAAILREEGVRCAAGGPIIVDGRLWGAMVVASESAKHLPPGSEHRVAEFAELVSTAISNIESHAKVQRLAAEQAALRRVAEVVARQAPSEQVFALVTGELSHVLDVDLVRTVRFEPDGSVTVLASHGTAEDRLGPGTNVPLPSGTVIDRVYRTGGPARVEDYAQVRGPVGDVLRHEGARSGAGGPIVVNGRLWGAMAVGSTARTLAPGTEDRVAQFAELVTTAISNLAPSRGAVGGWTHAGVPVAGAPVGGARRPAHRHRR